MLQAYIMGSRRMRSAVIGLGKGRWAEEAKGGVGGDVGDKLQRLGAIGSTSMVNSKMGSWVKVQGLLGKLLSFKS